MHLDPKSSCRSAPPGRRRCVCTHLFNLLWEDLFDQAVLLVQESVSSLRIVGCICHKFHLFYPRQVNKQTVGGRLWSWLRYRLFCINTIWGFYINYSLLIIILLYSFTTLGGGGLFLGVSWFPGFGPDSRAFMSDLLIHSARSRTVRAAGRRMSGRGELCS